MKIDKIPVCDPIEKLIKILIEKNYIIKESSVSDFHFHELYFKMQSVHKINLEKIAVEKINLVEPSTFCCSCHWSIVEINN